jgi:hypothetical protein
MSKYSQCTYVVYPETSACWDIGDVCVIPIGGALSSSHEFQHNFQLFVSRRCPLCPHFLASLQTLDRHSLLVAAIPRSHYSALSTWNNLGEPIPKFQKIKIRKFSRPLVLSRFTERLVRVLSDNAEEMRWGPILREHRVLSLWRFTCSNNSRKHDDKLRLFVCYVRKLILQFVYLRCPPRQLISHISASIDSWKYVDGNLLCPFKWVLHPLWTVTYLSMALETFVGPWQHFSFLIFYTVGRAPWNRDQPVPRHSLVNTFPASALDHC